jgi:hypothetical protein
MIMSRVRMLPLAGGAGLLLVASTLGLSQKAPSRTMNDAMIPVSVTDSSGVRHEVTASAVTFGEDADVASEKDGVAVSSDTGTEAPADEPQVAAEPVVVAVPAPPSPPAVVHVNVNAAPPITAAAPPAPMQVAAVARAESREVERRGHGGEHGPKQHGHRD